MLGLAVAGNGARAKAVAAAIEIGAGMTLAERSGAGAIVAAGETPGETLALARDALESGMPTLCLTMPSDPATLEELDGLAIERGVALSLPNGLRYLPSTIALRDTLRRGEAGPLLSVFLAWRTTHPGGDPLATLGPAALDLLGWLVPGRVARSQATVAALFGPDRDAALLLLRDEAELVRTVELVTGLPPTLEFGEELLIEILGEDGALRAEPLNQAITIATGNGRTRREWGVTATAPMMDEFVAALAAGTEPPGSPAELRPTLALLASLAQ